jgi:hypothetical protein
MLILLGEINYIFVRKRNGMNTFEGDERVWEKQKEGRKEGLGDDEFHFFSLRSEATQHLVLTQEIAS